MKLVGSLLTLLFVLTSFQAFSFPRFKYYGQNFYELGLDTDSPKLSAEKAKMLVRNVLSVYHEKTDGYDRILKNCDSYQNCYRQKKLNYSSEVRPSVMAIIDSEEVKGPLKTNFKIVKTAYCKKVYKVRLVNGRYEFPPHTRFNVEHTFPKSRFKKYPHYDVMVGDLHNLYPVDSETNSLRGSYFFNDLPGDKNYISFCKPSEFGQVDGRFFFEPPMEHKGNVARAMMYFALRYNIPLQSKELKVLLNWHDRDPVDPKERERAERIYKIQRNRNPFIDHPQLAPFIGKALLTNK